VQRRAPGADGEHVPRIRLAPLVLAAAVAVPGVTAAVALGAGGGGSPRLGLMPSFAAPDAAAVAGRAWTYDSAVTAAGRAAVGRAGAARPLLEQLAALQRSDGGLDGSYDRRTAAGDGVARSGVVAWVGLAAVQYRQSTGSHRFDALAAGAARWLLRLRIAGAGVPGAGLMRGGPDVAWASTEHAFEAGALLAGLAGGRGPTARRARAALPGLDAAIDRWLLVRGPAGARRFRQGLGDDAEPADAQALGALWLLGRGRRAEALAVLRSADARLLVRHGALTGYRPFADGWGPDVIWTEGTLQMRMARAAAGLPTVALDAAVTRLAARGGGLPQADRPATGSPAGDYHLWTAAAPSGWRLLVRSDTQLLR
jgi:hypothetical protein